MKKGRRRTRRAWGGGTPRLPPSLAARVRANARSDVGISNVTLSRFARMVCSSDFTNVYSADRIPQRLAGLNRFITIVNLGRSGVPLGHFVTIVGTTDAIYYIDPYGLPCLVPEIIKFLQNCRRPVMYNLQQLQALDSVYCGLYAVLMARYMDPSSPRPQFRLKFNKKGNLKKNDRLCVRYLHMLL